MSEREPGSRLADELVLLLAAVAERAAPWLDRVAASSHDEHGPTPSPCGSCVVCALIALVRGEPNELAASSIDRLADVVALLRAVLADRWQPGEPHMPGFRPEPPPSGRVQRIPVRRR
ncbi:hypothetical protein [Actinokineospora sp. NBRC 105648]|uniref:hypothetical protein n=1 Tax=Actinokineospora sp. NBRC 105648 TaxID=3032206 RepID=UPI0024A2E07B|nr:hypothetical protein [Actinokineospora sp. NBRC 105648]GLZ39202.1 hypothetical protein Acsp05_28260 [Actinokineospora sp. NBRC 105648]